MRLFEWALLVASMILAGWAMSTVIINAAQRGCL